MAQAGWLAFLLLALSLALLGIAPYHQLLRTVCTGTHCPPGQLSPAEAAALAPFVSMFDYAQVALTTHLFAGSLFLIVAIAFIWRKPTHGAAVAGAFALTAWAAVTLAQVASQNVPALGVPTRLIQLIQLAAWLPLFGRIPNGRFHPGWLRWAALAVVPAAAVVLFAAAGPAGGQIMGLGLTAVAAGCLLHRYRSLPASPTQDQVAWAFAALLLLVAAQWAGGSVQPLPLPGLPQVTVTTGPPLSFAVLGVLLVFAALACLVISLLNDELFRMDVALNRALVYSLLTLFVIGGYALVVGYLSVVFRSTGSLWFSLVATGLVAAFFQPVRERVQRLVNQLLYGERDEPYRVLTRLGQRLEAALEPSAVLPTLVETVAQTLNLPYVGILTTQGGQLNVQSEWRAPDTPPSGSDLPLVGVPLMYKHDSLGELRVSPRRGEKLLPEPDRRLLADLAQQASAAVHAVRLMNDLRNLTAELQQARERLVIAREEERRRLRRDLHDDLAPTLAGLALAASSLADVMHTNPRKATMLAEQLHGAIRSLVDDIRRLAHDLRPPTLDELGLVAAIQERAAQFSQAGNGLQVTVSAEAVPTLPAAVEVAAYRIVQEALMNVARHAHAQTCHIDLTLGDSSLILEITDDGRGINAVPQPGVGLRSMHERAAELRGQCVVSSRPEGGTRVRVSLPIVRGVEHEPAARLDRG